MTPGRQVRPGSTPEAENLLAIARLGRPHGVRGEIRAEVLCPPVLSFEELATEGPLWLRREGQAPRLVKVEGLRPHQDDWLLTLEGLEVREEAGELNGSELCLERRDLPELPEGWYWEADLVGLAVVDRALGEIGRVAALEASGGQSVLVVKRGGAEGGRIQIPWVRALVRNVSVAGGLIEVDLPSDYPGLP
jgi:16S rRNA processing protein RimM